MSTILVEARRDPASGPALDQIAVVCRALGHDTFRWRGPLSGRVPYWRWLFGCDLAILWNGSHPRYQRAVARLQARGTPILYVELGWHPQGGTIQVDPVGINARSSWATQPLQSPGQTPLAVKERGDLLVILQLDRDTQITQLSPYFGDMRSFSQFVCRHSVLPVRVRTHPRQRTGSFALSSLPSGPSGVAAVWDDSPSLAAALAGARAVATINSSCGVEALAAGLPLLCYGKAIYRHAGAAYCLTAGPEETHQATSELAAGRCSLFREPVAELVDRIVTRQWPLEEIGNRLPGVLSSMLAPSDRTSQRRASNWITRFARDLPPRLLPRLSAH